jgi:hypothetical protein
VTSSRRCRSGGTRRVYGGIQYRTSMVVGQTMGRQIGERAVQQYLTPIR